VAHAKIKVILLGAAGSVGSTALNALIERREAYEIIGASTHTSSATLDRIKSFWPNATLCLTSKPGGPAELLKIIEETEDAIVLNAIAGSAGLRATFATLKSGKRLALANKESVVMAGDLLAKEKIIPVDSEHSALSLLLAPFAKEEIASLILTASGGPFRDYTLQMMSGITPEMALKHPIWQMGAKITIDSATLANKGLEVIEAAYLFSMDREQIEVVIHPQSIVHAMVRHVSGAIYGQMSTPDMSLPILMALSGGKEVASVKPLDFSHLELSFSAVDLERFPMLKMGYACSQIKGGYPIVYNSANEVAVEAFLKQEIAFLDISRLVEETLQAQWPHSYNSLDEVIEIDARSREMAYTIKEKFKR